MAQETQQRDAKTKNRIRDWKGLLADKDLTLKRKVFAAFFVLSTAMTFTQLGFIGIGQEGDYLGYVLALLGPISAVSLLLGKGLGTLFGLAAGGVLFLHARLQPLDIYERYFVSVPNSFLLYAFAGFLLGLFYAIALRNNPQGKRKIIYLAIVCFLASVIVSLLFLLGSLLNVAVSVAGAAASTGEITFSSEILGALENMGSVDVQVLLGFALMFLVSLACCRIVHQQKQNAGMVGIRSSFATRLFVVAALVFCSIQAVSYVVITVGSLRTTSTHMGNELKYLSQQLDNALERSKTVAKIVEEDQLSDASAEELSKVIGTADVLDGYDLDDGTIVVFDDDSVIYSYNPAYPEGWKIKDLFDMMRLGNMDEIAKTGTMREILYDTQARKMDDDAISEFSTAELGYMRVSNVGDLHIMFAMPSSMVFANRNATMRWAALITFVVIAAIYWFSALLLGKDVVEPIDRTNISLAKITDGDLTASVTEHGNVEFASLSQGINTTVDSLRRLIADAERRNEVELNTAKAIQASALPRVFPPFPEITAFDVFASMDAAKEVGGDFFDLFLIDDDTLGFLIADVSGKGIPGALFMMAAKTEIKNYLSTGMEPAQAIASANSRLCASNDAGMFVTVWAATLDWHSGLLTYVNAGHNPPLLRRGSGGSWEWLRERCGLFLGTFETAKYRQKTLTLEKGDELLLYTDGVNEAFNVEQEEYGNDRLEDFVTNHNKMHPREIVRALRADVAKWATGAEQSDDVTILALEFGVAPEVTGTVTVTATLDNFETALSLVTDELEHRLCPVDVKYKVAVALEELFVNVCNYAYADQPEPGTVQVSYAYGTNPSSITVELRDTGVPFDPLTLKDPTKPTNVQEATIGGLGIYMVKASMDDFTYLRDGDANVVVFRKGW